MFQPTELQAALLDRCRVIQELTDSLRQSLEIRGKLTEQNATLQTELKRLRESNERQKWITDRNLDLGNEKRLSQTTIDLVAESDFEDDEFYNKKQPTQEIDAHLETDVDKTPNPTIDEFKESLNENELKIFANVEGKFATMLNAKLHTVQEQLHEEQLTKAELESESHRLKQLLLSVKAGTAELTDLRAELVTIHKKEVDDLRQYFEKKCTDLEKQ